MEASLKSRSARALAWITGTLSSIVAICWAVVTYVFPDPTILGLGILNWKNFLSFFAAFVFMGAMLVAIISMRLPIILRRMVNVLLAAGLCAAFFIIGMEYAKPSFEFAQNQTRMIENDSPTLLGKRIEMVDNVRINLIDCRVVAQIPSCSFEFTSTNRDRKLSFHGETSFFEPNGNALRIDKVVVGNVAARYSNNIELIRNLDTRITIIFEQTREHIEASPSVKLVLGGLENSKQVVSFRDVPARS